MTTMKKFNVLDIGLIVLICATLFLLPTGCKTVTTTDASGVTTTSTQLDPVRTSAAIHAILEPGVALAIEKEPKTVTYFSVASIVLHTALNDGTFDPDKLQAELAKSLPNVSELQTPEVKAAIQATMGLYRAYFADVVTAKVDQVTWLKPVLTAVVDSIDASLPAQ